MRVGIGYDVHAFESGRQLILGGVLIEGARGLAGWSDADVLCHSVADALLGAANLGDLGRHFPKEEVTKGASSLDMLGKTASLVAAAGFRIENIDSTVVLGEVKIGPYCNEMAGRISEALRITNEQVSVKATTTDGLGFAGRGEGAAALAVVLVERENGPA